MGAPANNFWTDKTTELLKTLWVSGLTAEAIGKILGVSRNAIIGKKCRLGLQKCPVDAVRVRRKHVRSQGHFTLARVSIACPPMPPAPEPELDPNNPGVKIDGLKWNKGPSNCRAIISKDTKGEPRYCGQHNESGQSFCLPHCRMYFQQYSARRTANSISA